MTDIKQVSDWALTIAAEAAGSKLHHYERMADDNRLAQSIEAHARTLEQHEAFKREVSDATPFIGSMADAARGAIIGHLRKAIPGSAMPRRLFLVSMYSRALALRSAHTFHLRASHTQTAITFAARSKTILIGHLCRRSI